MEYEQFEESGIRFIFPKERLFRIEKSITFKTINHEGIKSAEFLFLEKKDDSCIIWIVEAKTGSPRPAKKEDFDSFINEVKDKLYDSLSLFLAIYLKRHAEKLPINFQEIPLENVKFKLVLIMTSQTYKEVWLKPLESSLSEILNPIVRKMAKIWNFPPTAIMVLNPSMAENLKLINNYSQNQIL